MRRNGLKKICSISLSWKVYNGALGIKCSVKGQTGLLLEDKSGRWQCEAGNLTKKKRKSV